MEPVVEKTWVERKRYNLTLRYLKTLRKVVKAVDDHRTRVWKAHARSNMTFGTDITDTGIDAKKAGI